MSAPKAIKRIFVLMILACCAVGSPGKLAAFDKETLHTLALEESLIPIRPGVPGQSPFWNIKATRFIHVPSFDLKTVEGASRYRFTALSKADNKKYTFEADKPWVLLAPVWKELPVGYVDLEVEGVDDTGKVLGSSGSLSFYRAAVFNGPYRKPVTEYCESAHRGLEYLLKTPHFQRWKNDGVPDSSYQLYCYPSKMVAKIIDGMLLYTEISPADRKDALTVAERAAKYLISVSEQSGSPLEFFPPTYDHTHAWATRVAKEYDGQVMLNYCFSVASAYLNLYEVNGDTALFNAAKGIADTFARIQLPDGNWPLKMYTETGEAVVENHARVGGVIALFIRLQDKLGSDLYREQIKLAEPNRTKPSAEFNFEGQFEDVAPSMLYQNLSHAPARQAADYYFDRADETPGNLEKAKEILRFAEDQFVVWERPCPVPRPEREDRTSKDWFTPCVLEQYHYYVPIDGSAASFIESFLKAYEVTGDTLYLAKAVSLADEMTVVQDPETGRYPTYWWKESWEAPGWINCAIHDAQVMWKLGKFMEELASIEK